MNQPVALNLLFLGGTGVISSAAVARASALGHRVTVMNRGVSAARPVPAGVEVLVADVRDTLAVRAALGNREFDAVADFLSFTADHAAAAVDLYRGRTGQYVFISSASAYQKPPARLPVLESTPLRNPFWQYSRDKIAGEDILVQAYRNEGFPGTIVRRIPMTPPWCRRWAIGRISTGCGPGCRCWCTATALRCGP